MIVEEGALVFAEEDAEEVRELVGHAWRMVQDRHQQRLHLRQLGD